MKDACIEKLKKTEIQDLLRAFSSKTWRRLGFCQQFKNEVKTYETTITQNLIFEMLEFARLTGTPQLRLLEALDESANGNDIEIYVRHGGGYILFPTQAKSLYPSGKYEKINHQSGGKFQIHALLEYAAKRQGIPLYLLYNYHPKWQDVVGWEGELGFEYDCFGCSLVNAHLLEHQYFDALNFKWIMPGFFDLHPRPAIPLFRLLDLSWIEELWKASKKHVPELAVYDYKEVFDEKNWIDHTPPPSISGFPKDVHFFQGVVELNVPEFKPKFRLVLSKEKKRGTVTIREIA